MTKETKAEKAEAKAELKAEAKAELKAEKLAAKELKEVVVKEPVEEIVEEIKVGKNDFEVIDSLGNTVRVFTKKDHGSEAKDLAASFAKKFSYKIK